MICNNHLFAVAFGSVTKTVVVHYIFCNMCRHIWYVCILCVCVCSGGGVEGYWDSSLITALILFSQRPLKLLLLHQVSAGLPGNQGSGVPERRCLFPTNDLPERGKMGGGEDECRKDTNW